jgi:DNA-binding transcriptional MerR regulator
VRDVAAYLRVPAKTIYTWRGKGYGPPARRMGKHLRYRPVDVVAWAETSTETAA